MCEKGYDAERGTFTQYYGSTELDAAVLLIPEVGFLPPDDPRVVSTVETIQRELMSDGLVLRYTQHPPRLADRAGRRRRPDRRRGSVPGLQLLAGERAALIGRYDDAVALFEQLLALRNDVGLLAEEYDPRYWRQVGNFPQAFSHMPLIQSALNLEDHAGQHRRGGPPGAAGSLNFSAREQAPGQLGQVRAPRQDRRQRPGQAREMPHLC